MKRLFIVLGLIAAVAVGAQAWGRGFGGGGGRSFGGGGRSFGGGGRDFGGDRDFGGRTPSFGNADRTSFARPESRPSFVPQNRSFENRGNINDNLRPSWADNRPDNFRPDNSRPTFANRPDWNGNRPEMGNNFNNRDWNNNINRWANNRPNNWNHPWYNHYDQWHNGWHHGYWNYWGHGYYPWAWFGAGAALGWWASPGTTYVYDNPYYVAPVDSSSYYPNYSQPISPPANETASPDSANMASGVAADQSGVAPDEDANAQKAMAICDTARALFKKADYQAALDKVNQAIQILPSDATLHEFRALCLFALKQYKEAAAGIYAVLAAGPGWDWDTMRALYPDTNTYTTQLRALEQFQKSNPDATYASFLLAYHYLVMGYPDQATKELQRVVNAQPDDKLSAALLQALQQRNQASPTPSPPTVGSNANVP